MTMIIALATERFALVVGDRLTVASTDGEAKMSNGEVHQFKAGDRRDVQNVYLSADGRDVLAFAGDIGRAVAWARFARELHGFDCDDALSHQMFTDASRFSELPLSPDERLQPMDSCLHVWGEESCSVVTKIQASLGVATRESWRSGPKKEPLRVIGTGVLRFEAN
jgi:hypothetical protein